MTSLSRLDRLRMLLVLATLVFAALWAATAGLLVMMVFFQATLSIISGILVLFGYLWVNRRVLSNREVALWLEWRVPALQYSLVTLAEGVSGSSGQALERAVAETSWTAPVRGALLRRLLLPFGLFLVAVIGTILLPPLSDRAALVSGGTPDRRAQASLDPFSTLIVTVTPPGYARRPTHRLESPEAVSGLVGSAIRIEGNGWSTATTMPDTAMPFWLVRDSSRRLVVLLPVHDSVPEVQLLLPSRDSVLRGGSGSMTLTSTARDDFGIASAWFEYIVSSGEGESYTFRSGIVGRRVLANASRSDLTARIVLDSLKLAPGNIVHLRAVAQDGNNVSGPGIGFSETRTIRIPRPGEGDSVSVDRVARAEGDSSLLSQRMLVMLAEALERRRSRLTRDTFVSESRRIAGDQAALRRRVADIIFLRLGAEGSMEQSEDSTAEPLTPEAMLQAAEQATATGSGETLDFTSDETPVVALNRPLLEAYNAMWAAGRELEIGEPRRALPHMREALEAIQRARQAERIYLRGRPATSVIDIAKVRLAGSLADAAPSATRSSSRDPRLREALMARYGSILSLLPGGDVVDSLQLLRIDALDAEPRFAAVLGEAVTALRNGRDATGSLIRARRALAGPLHSEPGLGAWSTIP